jgi:hypothetical protein
MCIPSMSGEWLVLHHINISIADLVWPRRQLPPQVWTGTTPKGRHSWNHTALATATTAQCELAPRPTGVTPGSAVPLPFSRTDTPLRQLLPLYMYKRRRKGMNESSMNHLCLSQSHYSIRSQHVISTASPLSVSEKETDQMRKKCKMSRQLTRVLAAILQQLIRGTRHRRRDGQHPRLWIERRQRRRRALDFNNPIPTSTCDVLPLRKDS